VGRAAENGITAALMASMGYTADKSSLDGPWGYFAVQGGGVTETKTLNEDFGSPWSIIEPGVSIKPYPCGVLTHPTIDLMLKLVTEHDIQPDAIKQVTIKAGSNILNPIRYPIAHNHLQAKFSLQAVLSMIALNRKAGKVEFEDEFVQGEAMQTMQKRMVTEFDPDIEAMGFDKMRSSIHIEFEDGHTVSGDADERYRGGPENPLTLEQLQDKVRSCCEGVLNSEQTESLIEQSQQILEMDDAAQLAGLIQGEVANKLKVAN
jgi:2-methylcitrate dehydratase PrpD